MPNQCPYQVSTSYTLQLLRYSPDKLFPKTHPPGHLDTIGENNTPTALNGCGVKTEGRVKDWLGLMACSYSDEQHISGHYAGCNVLYPMQTILFYCCLSFTSEDSICMSMTHKAQLVFSYLQHQNICTCKQICLQLTSFYDDLCEFCYYT